MRASKLNRRPVVVIGDVAYVALSAGYEAKIDAADAELVGQWNWSTKADRHGVGRYAYRAAQHRQGQRQRNILLHRFLADPPENMVVDHINGDGFDNRRANLRICSHQENLWNRSRKVGHSYPGITACAEGFVATLRLGVYPTLDAAVDAVTQAARKVRGSASYEAALAKRLMVGSAERV